MKKGRHYIKPASGTGDKKGTNIPNKKKPKVSGSAWDGTSRPSNDLYRENFAKIFEIFGIGNEIA